MIPGTIKPHSSGTVEYLLDSDLYTIITDLNMDSNVEIVLDAGSNASATNASSQQYWYDYSGNNLHFFVGNTASANSDDPTFVGANNNLQSYWLVGNSTFFTANVTGNFTNVASGPLTWWDSLTASNTVYTMLLWLYPNSESFNNPQSIICGTRVRNGIIGKGFDLVRSIPGNQLNVQIFTADGTTAGQYSFGAPNLSNNTWNFISITVNTISYAGRAYRSNAFVSSPVMTTFNSYFTGATANGGSNHPYQIGASPLTTGERLSANCRISMFAGWSRDLSQTEITNIYKATKRRYGG